MRYTITLFLILISASSFAQYQPLISDSTSWYIKHEIWDGAFIEHLYLGDTVTIGSKLYHEVMLEEGTFQGVAGYLREDPSTGKAWLLGIEDTSEYMIMDLSLSAGDSFYVKMFPYGEAYAHVAEAELVNGKKVLTLDYHFGGGFIDEELKFMEGVGPNATFLYQVDYATASQIEALFGYLVCTVYEGSILTYAWDTITFECGPLFDGISQQQLSGNYVPFPNPATDLLYINGFSVETTLFTPMGIEIMKTKATVIPVAHLPRGIYYVHIKSEGKPAATTKVILQ